MQCSLTASATAPAPDKFLNITLVEIDKTHPHHQNKIVYRYHKFNLLKQGSSCYSTAIVSTSNFLVSELSCPEKKKTKSSSSLEDNIHICKHIFIKNI